MELKSKGKTTTAVDAVEKVYKNLSTVSAALHFIVIGRADGRKIPHSPDDLQKAIGRIYPTAFDFSFYMQVSSHTLC
ncbi:MAG: hypothetical protein RR482_08500, partial [Clostridia bacterium]